VSIVEFAQPLIALAKQLSVEAEWKIKEATVMAESFGGSSSFRGNEQNVTAMNHINNQGTKKAPAIHQGSPSRPMTTYSNSDTARGVRFQPANPTLSLSQNEANDADSDSSIGLTAAQIAFLSLRILPARLSRWQTATLLGLTTANVSSLIKAGVLTPLNQGDGTTIYFALIYIMAVRDNYEKLFEITNTLIILDAEKRARALAAKAKA
jgi:hypothetical protein